MKNDNCIFCKIANGEIPSRTLYEDERYRVILDMGPATRGHALVLPKEHFENLYEIPDEWAAGALAAAKKVAVLMKDKAAGQTVMHFHMHIIPRYKNDNANILWKPTSPSAGELDDVLRQITG